MRLLLAYLAAWVCVAVLAGALLGLVALAEWAVDAVGGLPPEYGPAAKTACFGVSLFVVGLVVVLAVAVADRLCGRGDRA